MPKAAKLEATSHSRWLRVAAGACIIALASTALVMVTTTSPQAIATTCTAGMTAVSDQSNVCERVFTANGTFTVPTGANLIQVLIVGGGGGGGAGGTNSGGGGGGGGSFKFHAPPVVPGASYTITVGSGGPRGAAASGGIGGETLVDFAGTPVSTPGGAGGTRDPIRGGVGGAGTSSGGVGGADAWSGGGGGGGSVGGGAGVNSGVSPGGAGGAGGAGNNAVLSPLFPSPGDAFGAGGGGGGGGEMLKGAAGGAGGTGGGGAGGTMGSGSDANPDRGGGGGGGGPAADGGIGANGRVVVRVRFDAPAPAPAPGPAAAPAPAAPTQAELAEQLMIEESLRVFLALCNNSFLSFCIRGQTEQPAIQDAPKPQGSEFITGFTISGTSPNGAKWESNVRAKQISRTMWTFFTLIGDVSLQSLEAQGFSFDLPTTFTTEGLLTAMFGYLPDSRYQAALEVSKIFFPEEEKSSPLQGRSRAGARPGDVIYQTSGRANSDGTAEIAVDIPADAPSGLYTLRVTGVLPGPELITLNWPVQVLQFGTPVLKETSTTIGFRGNSTTLSARGKTKTATFAASVPQGAAVLETRVIGYPANGQRKQAKARASDVAAALRSDGAAPQEERVRGNGDVSKWPDRAGKVYVTLRYLTQERP